VKIIMGNDDYLLDDDHPYALAILALAQRYAQDRSIETRVGSRGGTDIEMLWRFLTPRHRQLLYEIAKRPGISQSELETALGLDWKGLRGVHNGLARICEGLGYEKPIRVSGYKSSNRSYSMDPDVRQSITKLKL